MTSNSCFAESEQSNLTLTELLQANARTAPRQKVVPRHVAVIYTRYSSDRQTEMSVERQREICEEHAVRCGLTIASIFSDRAKSGTTFVGRFAFEEMLQAAERLEFNTLIVENVDRLARDLSDLSHVFKKLTQLGIEMHQPGRGRLGLPDIAFHGFMGEEGRRLFLDRVQRGRIQSVRQGKISTKASYGYTAVPGKPGERRIVPEHSKVVIDIYRMRLEGLTTRQISLALNARGDTGKVWKVGGVESVLSNPLYAGVHVYNRNAWVEDKGTIGNSGIKKKLVPRPPSEWIVVPVKHLRIVERSVWEAVQEMHLSRKLPKGKAPPAARKYLLSGKVRCPGCGLPMSVEGMHAQRRFGCVDKKAGGICKSPTTIKLDELESFMIELIGEKILGPGGAEAYIEGYNEARSRSLHDLETKRLSLRREADRLYEKLDATLVEAMTTGLSPTSLVRIRKKHESELADTERALELLPPKPRPVGVDRQRLTMLREALEGLAARVPFRPENEADRRLAAAFGDLIDYILVTRPAYGKFEVEVRLTVMPLIEGGSSLDEGAEGMVLRASYARKKDRPRSTRWKPTQPMHLASERHILSDSEWDAIRHLLPAGLVRPFSNRGTWDFRLLVQTHLFILMSGTPFCWLPERFGPWEPTYYAVSRLVVLGVWREIMAVLAKIDPDRFEARFAEASWKQLKPSARGLRIVAERRAAEAAGSNGADA